MGPMAARPSRACGPVGHNAIDLEPVGDLEPVLDTDKVSDLGSVWNPDPAEDPDLGSVWDQAPDRDNTVHGRNE